MRKATAKRIFSGLVGVGVVLHLPYLYSRATGEGAIVYHSGYVSAPSLLPARFHRSFVFGLTLNEEARQDGFFPVSPSGCGPSIFSMMSEFLSADVALAANEFYFPARWIDHFLTGRSAEFQRHAINQRDFEGFAEWMNVSHAPKQRIAERGVGGNPLPRRESEIEQ